jgi:hypothetical protein
MDNDQRIKIRDTASLLNGGLLINAIANALVAFALILDPVVTNGTVRILVSLVMMAWMLGIYRQFFTRESQ